MPPVTPERWVRVREIFAAALAEPPDRRSSFLAEACAGDPTLQAEAQALLASHREAGSFIEHGPRFDPTAADVDAPEAEEAPAPRPRAPSAPSGSSAASAKEAWAPCTRRSRTTRAASSPSR